MACIDEDGYLADWVYEVDSAAGYDMYFGDDRSAAVQQSWYAVSNSAVFYRTGGMLPALGLVTEFDLSHASTYLQDTVFEAGKTLIPTPLMQTLSLAPSTC